MGFTVPIMCDMFREELQLTMRSPDRGQIWENIAAALGFTLTSKQKQKLRDEEKASKIE